MELRGRTYVHDLTGYGIKVPNSPSIFVAYLKFSNIRRNGFYAQNHTDTATANIHVGKIEGDRSMQSASVDPGFPSVQVIGTEAHLTHFVVTDVDLKNPTLPVSGNAEGMEVRYSYGSLRDFSSVDGSIGLSIAQGSCAFGRALRP